jgi:hypothetical protein
MQHASQAPIHRRLRTGRGLAAWLLAVLIGAPAAVSAATYRWVGEDGKVHYGDNIPPQSIDRPYRRLDKWGNVELEVAAQPNAEERAARRHAQAEAEAREEEARRRQVRDRMLLETYSDPAQLAAERDRSLLTVDASIALTQAAIERIGRRKAGLLERIAATNHEAERQALEAELNEVSQQLEEQEGSLAQRRREREALAAKYAADMARLEELRSGGSASRPPGR